MVIQKSFCVTFHFEQSETIVNGDAYAHCWNAKIRAQTASKNLKKMIDVSKRNLHT